MATPNGTPSPSVRRLRLTPPLARSVGLGPVFSPAERSLCHCAVHRLPFPIDPFQLVVLQQAGLPQIQEHPGGDPFPEPVVCRAARTDAGGIERVPLAAGAQHKQDSVHAFAVVGPGPPAAEAVGVHALGQKRLEPGPKFIRDHKRFFFFDSRPILL